MQSRESLLILVLSFSVALHAAAFSYVKKQAAPPVSLPEFLDVRLEIPRPVMREAPVPDAARERSVHAAPVPRRDPVPLAAIPRAREEVAVAEPALPAVPAQEPPRVAASPVVPTASAAPDPGVLESYGKTLSDRMARFQRYPRIAQMRGWQGRVQLKLYIARKGQIINMEIVQSSGHESLDQQALEMARSASPLPPMPSVLQEREFTVVVPVVFSLRESS
jgi:protein TonB